MKLKKIINLFGGPCVGKSVVASELFASMKKEGYNVELVTEYAKELTYEGRFNVLEQDQLYVFTKQHRRILRLKEQVEYIISDAPLLLSIAYSELNPNNIYNLQIFSSLVLDVIDNYNNLNVILSRNENFEYQQTGRYQNENEAKHTDGVIERCIYENCEEYFAYKDGLPVKTVCRETAL
jgi:tRNA uridine 5-carbamoylmethylation protein Kti12